MANNTNGNQAELEALALATGQSVEELMAKVFGAMPREDVLQFASNVRASMTPEEEAVQSELDRIARDNKRNEAFSLALDIPPEMVEYAETLYEAGQWPESTLAVALAWGLVDRTTNEVVFGRHIYGDGNMVVYPKRLSNARRRNFVPNDEFGTFTLIYKKTQYAGNDGIKKLLELTTKVIVGDNNPPTYLYRACKALADNKPYGKDGLMLPKDIQCWHPMIPGCTPANEGSKTTLLSRYFEWFENHAPDLHSGTVITKAGHLMALEDYVLPNGAKEPLASSEQSDDDDIPSDGVDELSDEPEEQS